MRTLTLIPLLILTLCACNLGTTDAPESRATATTARVALLASPPPTLARPLATVNAATPTAASAQEAAEVTPTAESDPCALPAESPSTAHDVDAQIDFSARTAEVEQFTTYINRTGTPLGDIVFNVEPNYWANAFTLIGVSGMGEGGSASLTGRRLTVALPEALNPGCGLTLTLRFSIVVPMVASGVEAFKGYYGSSARQMNLGHWLPTIAVRANGGWVTRESFFTGEQNVLDVADWTVALRVKGDDVLVAGPGDLTDLGAGLWRGTLKGARDFSLSLSDQFTIKQAIAENGARIDLYTMGDTTVQTASGSADSAAFALVIAQRSLELFSTLFGDLGLERLVVVQGDFPDGMEFTGMVFVSSTWFEQYDGTPQGYLTLITIHEVAHQWWYARVGNDSALSPWLDEALSTYSEYAFLEQFYPTLTDWWWDFRVDRYAPTGFVDSTVYEFTTVREYINAVYLNGVRMMHALRQDLGSEAFWGILRGYAEVNAGRLVTPSAFWAQFTPEQLNMTSITRGLYLRRPQVN